MAQVWLVTGSSRGLGHAIVEAGLAAGNKVLATARDIKSLADLSERYGDQVKLFAMDVTDEAAAANAAMAAVDVFGSLDVVINNAGYGNLSSVEDTPLSEFRAQIETNLFGTIIVTKAALRYFREKKAGRFIQFSSVGGRIGPPGRGALRLGLYCGTQKTIRGQTSACRKSHQIGNETRLSGRDTQLCIDSPRLPLVILLRGSRTV